MNPWDVLVQRLEETDITSESVSRLRRVIAIVLDLIERTRTDEDVSEDEEDSEEMLYKKHAMPIHTHNVTFIPTQIIFISARVPSDVRGGGYGSVIERRE